MASLAWLTDIHLDFLSEPERDRFADEVAAAGADAVLLGGDIADGPRLVPLLSRFGDRAGAPVYFVLGNHDAYHGSIAETRAQATALTASHASLRWLPAAGVVELGGGAALIGHDGWADARLGDYERSPVMLNDYLLIRELAGLSREARRRALERLGDEAAAAVRAQLDEALASYRKILLLTHVPPFETACWHEGRISDADWLPHFACKAVGDVLHDAMRARPDAELLVLCGHTHGAGEARILPNLTVWTGGAEYGAPAVQRVFSFP